MGKMAFAGFKHELIGFLRDLGANNSRQRFEAHREDYEAYLVQERVLNEVFSDQLPGRCFQHYQRVAPLQRWLGDLLAA